MDSQALDVNDQDLSHTMYGWVKDLFPICRSLTGAGVRQTLDYISSKIDHLNIKSISSGTNVYDWVVPNEWNIAEAWVKAPDGSKIIDFEKCNLHVVSYSRPVNEFLSLEQLKKRLHSIPDQPTAIPYVTNYYGNDWGFCIASKKLADLEPGDYHCYIKSQLKPGTLDFADLVLKGDSDQEVFISTYICHPSMANNELSGPAVALALALWLKNQVNLRYTYRFVFIPETIGSIAYINLNLDHLKQKVFSGFNLTCIGDDRTYSFLPSRQGDTISDRVAMKSLQDIAVTYDSYSWLDRGSDERQYCAPGVDLPIASIMRSKYGTYPEYHTSLDDLEFVTPSGLLGGFKAVQYAIFILETNFFPISNVTCEPFLTKYNLIDTISFRTDLQSFSRLLLDITSIADGSTDLLQISDMLGVKYVSVLEAVNILIEAGILKSKTYSTSK